MVDSTNATESKYVTVELVKASQTKRLQIVGEGKYESTDYGDKLTLPVEIDGKQKLWRPNQATCQNLQEYGKDTKTWVGMVVGLKVLKDAKGKDAVIGFCQPSDVKSR